MDDLEEISSFFAMHPEDTKFELEHPEEAEMADTNAVERLTNESYKKDDFTLRCERGYRRFIHDCRQWARKDNDVIIAVCGPEGSGKSLFCLKFCKDLDPSFILERNVLLRPTPETLEKTIFEVNQYGCLLIDEAMDVMYKRQSATSGNIGINKLFARVRKFNRIAVIALPDFNDLDAFFRKRRVRIRIEIIERGLAFVMVSKHLVGNDDPWFFDYNAKVLANSFEEMDMTKSSSMEKLAIYEQFRCFETPVIWNKDDVPQEEWARYVELAKKSSLEAQHIEALSKERLGKPEKAYRRLFAELSKRYMAMVKTTHEETYALFTKMLGSNPPFSFETFKFLTMEKKTWRQMKKQARIAVREKEDEDANKPDDLLEGLV